MTGAFFAKPESRFGKATWAIMKDRFSSNLAISQSCRVMPVSEVSTIVFPPSFTRNPVV